MHSSTHVPHQHCPVCKDSHIHHLLEGRDRLHGVEGSWSLFRCPACGLGFLNPTPAPEAISNFYPNDYYAYYPPSLPQRPEKLFKRIDFNIRQFRKKAYAKKLGYPISENYSSLVRLLVSIFPPATDFPAFREPGTLLDVGCGAGQYLLEMKSLGWNVKGVELSEHAVKAAQSAGLDVVCGTLESAKLDSSVFAVIRLNDVLEHVPDPHALLKEIHRILVPGGHLQVTLPNLDAWTFSLFHQYWFPLEIPRHLFFFTPDSLTRIATDCGYTVKSLKVWSHKEVDVIPSLQYYLRENHPGLFKAIDRPFIWKLIRKSFAPFKFVANLFSKGSAMTIWLEKSE